MSDPYYGPPQTRSLPAASRKHVARHVRAGRPSVDPVLRAVEQQLGLSYLVAAFAFLSMLIASVRIGSGSRGFPRP